MYICFCYSFVQVTKKHLAGRIDQVDATLDETQQIIEGTRDEVGIFMPH
jgi:bacterioferritin-associated ferredoxin